MSDRPPLAEIDHGEPREPRAHAFDGLRRQLQKEQAYKMEREEAEGRARRWTWLVKAPLAALALCACGAAGADYSGLVHIGIFPDRVAPEPAPVVIPPILQRPSIQECPPPSRVAPVVVAPVSEPQAEPVPVARRIDPAETARLKDRLDHAANGARMLRQDLAAKDAALQSYDLQLNGTWQQTKNGPVRLPNGYLELMRQESAILTKARVAQAARPCDANLRALTDAEAMTDRLSVLIHNTGVLQGHDRDVAASLRERLAKAQADEADARTAHSAAAGR